MIRLEIEGSLSSFLYAAPANDANSSVIRLLWGLGAVNATHHPSGTISRARRILSGHLARPGGVDSAVGEHGDRAISSHGDHVAIYHPKDRVAVA